MRAASAAAGKQSKRAAIEQAGVKLAPLRSSVTTASHHASRTSLRIEARINDKDERGIE